MMTVKISTMIQMVEEIEAERDVLAAESAVLRQQRDTLFVRHAKSILEIHAEKNT